MQYRKYEKCENQLVIVFVVMKVIRTMKTKICWFKLYILIITTMKRSIRKY